MNEDERVQELDKFIIGVAEVVEKLGKINPRKKAFNAKAVRCILKQVLSGDEYRIVSEKVPLLLKDFKHHTPTDPLVHEDYLLNPMRTCLSRHLHVQ